ncbi:MAG: helix-turn-helix domain-containing protein [Deltaproteobacteria bacterium]|nr:helix-turn-helix domain-containing protein [Deltaproteobacteria bacterium]
MPRRSPYIITLSEEERRKLELIAKKYSSPHRDVIRAKIVLLAAQGFSNDVIASRLDTPRQVVSKWRKRYFEDKSSGLQERSRKGRPVTFSPWRGDGGKGDGG